MRLGNIVIGIILFLIIVVPIALGIYGDWLWFLTVGYQSIFIKVLLTSVEIGIAAFLIFFGFSYVAMRLAKRAATGKSRRKADPKSAFLGVRFSQTPHPDGVLVEQVVPNAPAAKAGMKAGDVITEFDGKKVGSVEDIIAIMRKKKPGDKVKIKVLRNGEEVKLEATLEERGNR